VTTSNKESVQCKTAYFTPRLEPSWKFWYPAYFGTKFLIFGQSIFLLLLCLLHPFFLSIDMNTVLATTCPLLNDLGRRTPDNSLLLTIRSIVLLPRLTFAFCIIARFFLSWSNRKTFDIDPLAEGLDGHGLGSDWTQGITKNMGNPRQFFFLAELTFPL
jgi:hypothetical protein